MSGMREHAGHRSVPHTTPHATSYLKGEQIFRRVASRAAFPLSFRLVERGRVPRYQNGFCQTPSLRTNTSDELPVTVFRGPTCSSSMV